MGTRLKVPTRTFAGMRPHWSRKGGATPDKLHCLWCGRRLRKVDGWFNKLYPEAQYGSYGDNQFCGLRCGYAHARAMVAADVGWGPERGKL